MKAKDLITWGLILYVASKILPPVFQQLEASAAADRARACAPVSPMISTETTPVWIGYLTDPNAPRFTQEGNA